jgi:Flp pilus assembly protein CpaB
VLAGLFAAVGIRSYLEKPEAPPQQPPKEAAKPEAIKVPIAAVDLPADRAVTPLDVMIVTVTKQELKEKYHVERGMVVTSLHSITNRYLAKPVKQGQPFVTTDFYLEGTTPSVAKKLQPGFRAIRVQVPATREAGVQKGMFVDVFFRSHARPAKGDQLATPEKTITLLKHVEVIDAERPAAPRHGKGEAATTTPKKPLYFTLSVPEASADSFSVVEGRGELWLVPTPSNDKAKSDGAGTEVANADTLAELLGVKPKAAPPAPFETAVYSQGRLKINRFMNNKQLANHSTYDDTVRERGNGKPTGDDESNTPLPPAPGKVQ